jgi:hypothetical protein
MKASVSLLLACLSSAAAAQPVAAGSDTVDRAIVRLVPSPFKATVDPRVPAGTVLSWSASDDWMPALLQAASTAGLRVEPRFDAGRIDVLPGQTVQGAKAEHVVPIKRGDQGPMTQLAQVELTPVKPIAAAKAAPVAADTPTAASFVLQPGKRIDAQFGEWSKQEGWSLLWTSDKSWVIPGTSSVAYVGPVDVAVEAAIKDLYANGVPVRLDIWEANKVMEISHAK